MSEPAVDIGLGKPMPDDPTDPPPGLLEDASDAAIDAELARRFGESADEKPEPEKPQPAPEPQAKQAAESTAPQAAAPTPEATPQAQHPEEFDEAAMARREAQLERERFQAELELQKQHNSRLAGKIGELTNIVRARAQVQPDQDQGFQPDPGLQNDLTQRLDRLESARIAEASNRAVMEEIAMVDARPEMRELLASPNGADALKAAAAKYSEDWAEAQRETDPTLARKMAHAAAGATLAEARAIRFSQEKAEAEKRSAEQRSKLRDAKMGESPASMASSARAGARAKTIDDLTDDELERMTDDAVSASR